MPECVHEWYQKNTRDLKMDPPKVNLGCRLCGSETYELEAVWDNQQALPRLGERVGDLEVNMSEVINKLEALIEKKEKKAKK